MRRLIRFIVLALLAWLPLQAAALPGLAALCELDPAHSPMHQPKHEASHGVHGHEQGGDDGAHGHDGPPGHGAASHGCCHHYSTAAPAIAVGAPETAHAVFLAVARPLRDFFPERPKRPPLAAL